jgi:hypothetical protein
MKVGLGSTFMLFMILESTTSHQRRGKGAVMGWRKWTYVAFWYNCIR